LFIINVKYSMFLKKEGDIMFEAKIYVSIKKTVADPQGKTVKHALESMGFKGLEEVRMGKFIELKLKEKDKAKAEAEVSDMCKKLLVNQIIEDYSFDIKEA